MIVRLFFLYESSSKKWPLIVSYKLSLCFDFNSPEPPLGALWLTNFRRFCHVALFKFLFTPFMILRSIEFQLSRQIL